MDSLKTNLEGTKREFELLETRIKNEAILQRITVVQCGQASRMVRAGVFQPVRGPCDFVLGVDGKIIVLDAKVTHERIWNLKKYVTHPAKIHQWAQLSSAYGNGNYSGYMIWFYDYQKIVWCPTPAILNQMEKKGLSVHPDTPGFTSQMDSQPIDFRKLFGDFK